MVIENDIIPTYYEKKERWARYMRQAVRISEGYFNSDRMVIEYFNRLYRPIAHRNSSNPEYEDEDLNTGDGANLDAWTYSNIK